MLTRSSAVSISRDFWFCGMEQVTEMSVPIDAMICNDGLIARSKPKTQTPEEEEADREVPRGSVNSQTLADATNFILKNLNVFAAGRAEKNQKKHPVQP